MLAYSDSAVVAVGGGRFVKVASSRLPTVCAKLWVGRAAMMLVRRRLRRRQGLHHGPVLRASRSTGVLRMDLAKDLQAVGYAAAQFVLAAVELEEALVDGYCPRGLAGPQIGPPLEEQ